MTDSLFFPSLTPKHQQGFSLLELLVVVGILAILGGVVVSQYTGAGQDAKVAIAKYEMVEIRKALVRYYKDNVNRDNQCVNAIVNEELVGAPATLQVVRKGKRFPFLDSPADFNFLLTPKITTAGVDADCGKVGYGQYGEQVWDVNNRLGFNGIYLKKTRAFVDVGGLDRTGGSTADEYQSTGAQDLVLGIADPFIHTPVAQGTGRSFCEENSSNDQCYLDWRTDNDSSSEPLEKFGRPYLLFDMTEGADGVDSSELINARIVSMGPDGRYAGENATDKCLPEGDDLVLCLFR